MIPSEISDTIRRRIAEAKRDAPDRLTSDGRAVRIYADVAGAAYITPEGEVLTQVWDADETPKLETNPNARYAALVIGTERWPELAGLLPSRPALVPDCSACGGSGWLQLGTAGLVCGYCGGLGWNGATAR